MEFEYYYLIQDILGVLIAAFSARVLYFFLHCLLKKGFSWIYAGNILVHAILLCSGLVLIIRPFELQTWVMFLLCISAFFGLHKRINKSE